MKKNITAIIAAGALLLTGCSTAAPAGQDVQAPETTAEAELTTDALDLPDTTTAPAVEVPTVETPESDFPEISFTPEKPEVDLTAADLALPAGSDAAYIVTKYSYFGSKLFRVELTVMDSHDNEIYSNYYDHATKTLGIPQCTRREYNADGKLSFYEVSYDGNVNYSLSYEYDENGFLTAEKGSSGGSAWSRLYVNDGFGNPVTVTSSDSARESTLVNAYTYDNDGNILSCKTSGEDAVGAGEQINEYDEMGRLVRTTMRPEQTPIVSIIEYAYDVNGNVVMEANQMSFEGKAEPGVVTYKDYDAKGRITRQLDRSGSQDQEDTYTLYEYTDLK